MAQARDSGDSDTEMSSTKTDMNGRAQDEGMNLLEVPWFHPDLTRHQAEAELQLAEEGVYLMRPRRDKKDGSIKGYALDVRCQQAVKHFQIFLRNRKIYFGQEVFIDVESFIQHFDNCPLIGDEGGKLMVCRYPYPRDVDELHDYNHVTTHFLAEQKLRKHKPQITDSSSSTPEGERRIYSLASKEGYLTKMGAVVKSWKIRWFVLRNEELSYYNKEKDSNPLRVIKLNEITEVSSCDIPNRQNVFRIVLPWRTFYLQASNAEVRKDWIKLLQWKLDELQQSRPTCQDSDKRHRSQTT